MSRAIFWDLQGTLGGGATESIDKFEFYPFSYEAMKRAEAAGFYNIIITNQSKIGKGIVTMEEYNDSVEALKSLLKQQDISITEWLCCPHTRTDNCLCKKPKTGLVEYCIKKYDLDRSACYVIGNIGKNEIIMAKEAGCKGVLVLTGGGLGSLNEFRDSWKDYEADIITENVLKAVEIIINN